MLVNFINYGLEVTSFHYLTYIYVLTNDCLYSTFFNLKNQISVSLLVFYLNYLDLEL